eukprot:g4806.t1
MAERALYRSLLRAARAHDRDPALRVLLVAPPAVAHGRRPARAGALDALGARVRCHQGGGDTCRFWLPVPPPKTDDPPVRLAERVRAAFDGSQPRLGLDAGLRFLRHLHDAEHFARRHLRPPATSASAGHDASPLPLRILAASARARNDECEWLAAHPLCTEPVRARAVAVRVTRDTSLLLNHELPFTVGDFARRHARRRGEGGQWARSLLRELIRAPSAGAEEEAPAGAQGKDKGEAGDEAEAQAAAQLLLGMPLWLGGEAGVGEALHVLHGFGPELVNGCAPVLGAGAGVGPGAGGWLWRGGCVSDIARQLLRRAQASGGACAGGVRVCTGHVAWGAGELAAGLASGAWLRLGADPQACFEAALAHELSQPHAGSRAAVAVGAGAAPDAGGWQRRKTQAWAAVLQDASVGVGAVAARFPAGDQGFVAAVEEAQLLPPDLLQGARARSAQHRRTRHSRYAP